MKAVKDAIAALDRRRSRLESKLARLTEAGPSSVVARLRQNAMRSSDKLTRKNRTKFEVMGRVLYYLDHPERRAGLSSAELFDLVKQDMRHLSFDTFRSYLSRFKVEGRLTHNQQHKLWKLEAEEFDSVENN